MLCICLLYGSKSRVSTYMEQYGRRNSKGNPDVSRWKAVCISYRAVTAIDSTKLINKKNISTEYVVLNIYTSHIYDILFNIRLVVTLATNYAM